MTRIVYILLCLVCSVSAGAQTDTLHVFFETDIDTLSDSANRYLSKYKDSIRKNDAVLIIGYADERGSDDYNVALSERRANAVSAFLIGKGLSNERIRMVSGKGEVKRTKGNLRKYVVDRKVDIVIISDTSEGRIRRKGMPDLSDKIEKTPINETIILRNMNFYLSLDIPTPASKQTMDDLLKVMQKRTNLRIQLEGHVCCIDDMNPIHRQGGFKLSLLRSVAIRKFLVDNGIAEERIKTKGFGHDKPLFPREETEPERLANRRVEIRLLTK
jgi:outer membrane protein OmpA-like peptidoglycan-associated protein